MSLPRHASPVVASALDELKKRQNPDGGFPIRAGDGSRPDATAWGILALRSCGGQSTAVEKAGRFLESFQLEDGRIVMARDEPTVVWVSYIAAWAWQGLTGFESCREKALTYILSISGNWRYINAWGLGHNQSLKGWPWIEGTSSWVDSTALALLALRAAGRDKHERYLEGIRLLKDRELPSGGWNCGNTIVYGTELRPTPESTAMALTLLDIRDKKHSASVEQLRQCIHPEAGPLTLAWSLMAIGTKQDLPVLEQALMLQQKDFCQTEWLSLLCMTWSLLVLSEDSAVLGFPGEGRV